MPQELLGRLLDADPQDRLTVLGALADEERSALGLMLAYDWRLWARPEQLQPDGAWQLWMLLGGRGSGKTRPASQQFIEWAEDNPYLAMMAKDDAMVRDVMIEGESGILACWPRWKPEIRYDRTKLRLTFPNGAVALKLTSEAGADAARGRQFNKAWAEEVAAWVHPNEAWNEGLMNAVRLGKAPQVMVTTTPKMSSPIVAGIALGPKGEDGRRLVSNEDMRRNHGISDAPYDRWYRWEYTITGKEGFPYRTVVARFSSERNSANLAPGFVESRRALYGSSRLAAEELDAELFEKIGTELWNEDTIEKTRLDGINIPLRRIVVAVDPTKADEPGDECGIVVAGLGEDGHAYVMADESIKGSPFVWASRALSARNTYSAHKLIYEKNRLGPVETTMRSVDPSAKWDEVHASDGKQTRAEPVSALYEQGRVHHVGRFPLLEDEMTTWDPKTKQSPNRMDALVWAITDLLLGEYRAPLIAR